MVDRRLVLHLGVFKTATTSLQRLLHHYRPLLAAHGWDSYAGTYDRMYDVIRLLHDFLRGNGDLHGAKLALAQLLTSEALYKVVSEEMLLGDMQAGSNLFGEHLPRFLQALEALALPPAHVVFVVRRIDRLLESYYLHNYAVGFSSASFSNYYATFNLEHLNWLEVIEAIRNSPAVGRVSVIPFELCRISPEHYTDAFFSACGLAHCLPRVALPRENSSFSDEAYRLVQTIQGGSWPEETKIALIKRIEPVLRDAPGESPDFLGDTRHHLLNSWAESSRALFAQWMPGAPPELLSYYLGQS